MKLKLQHCKNVDLMYGQGNGTGYWDAPVDPRHMLVDVADLADAQRKFISWRDRNHLGGGNMTRNCGDVMEGRKIVARISYNGRVWDANGKEIPLDPTKEQTPPAPFERMERLTVEKAEAFPDIMCNHQDGVDEDIIAFHRCVVTGFYVAEYRKRTPQNDLLFHAGIDAKDDSFTTLEGAVAWLKEQWLKLQSDSNEDASDSQLLTVPKALWGQLCCLAEGLLTVPEVPRSQLKEEARKACAGINKYYDKA